MKRHGVKTACDGGGEGNVFTGLNVSQLSLSLKTLLNVLKSVLVHTLTQATSREVRVVNLLMNVVAVLLGEKGVSLSFSLSLFKPPALNMESERSFSHAKNPWTTHSTHLSTKRVSDGVMEWMTAEQCSERHVQPDRWGLIKHTD